VKRTQNEKTRLVELETSAPSPVLAVNSATSPQKPSAGALPLAGTSTKPLQPALPATSVAFAASGSPLDDSGTMTMPSSPALTKRRRADASKVMRSHMPRGLRVVSTADADIRVYPTTPAHDGTGGVGACTNQGGGGECCTAV